MQVLLDFSWMTNPLQKQLFVSESQLQMLPEGQMNGSCTSQEETSMVNKAGHSSAQVGLYKEDLINNP